MCEGRSSHTWDYSSKLTRRRHPCREVSCRERPTSTPGFHLSGGKRIGIRLREYLFFTRHPTSSIYYLHGSNGVLLNFQITFSNDCLLRIDLRQALADQLRRQRERVVTGIVFVTVQFGRLKVFICRHEKKPESRLRELARKS